MNKKIVIDKNTGQRRCKCFKRCGGCQLDMPYEKQLEWKQNKAERMLSKFCIVQPIIAMEHPYNYRNKVQTVFRYNQHKQIISGVYQSGSGSMTAVDDCMLEDKHCTAVIQTIKALMKPFKISPYNNASGNGNIRHVLARYAKGTDELMVCIVTIGPILPSKNNFIKALLEKHPEITTIVQNICTDPMPLTLGDRQNILYGKGYITDIINGLKFRISPSSFYQVNYEQTRKLYSTAVEFAELSKNDIVIDAYCGTGTIGLLCASRAMQVIGAELNKYSCLDAEANAKLNNISNAEFYSCDAGKFMQKLAQDKRSVSVVMMDPPRAGSNIKFLKSLAELAPERIVYISCKIETLERDLKILKSLGYKSEKIQPVDMFPHTTGIECAVKLVRYNK